MDADSKDGEITHIAIIGMGYVGLPLAIQFAKNGVAVTGVDIDPSKVETLENKKSYIGHIPDNAIEELYTSGKFSASTDFAAISACDAVILCVPTPLNKHREPDLSFVLETGKAIAGHLKNGCLVSLESTTYPGTTEEDLRSVLEAHSGKTAGVDFHLAYSPEREDPSNPQSKVEQIPKIVGGLTSECRDKAIKLYSTTIQNLVPVDSCKVAEAAKLLENIFRAVNIALVNELKVIYDKMDINIWEVIEAARTKPFGFMPFYPGPGLGGHCIPIDPFYLTWKAREFGQNTRFIELAGEINTSMPNHVVSKVAGALNDQSKSIRGSRILLLGLAYKPNVDDDRESPSYVLIEKLEQLGATCEYNDPHIPCIQPTREHAHLAGRESVQISGDFDLILIATHHDAYKHLDFSNFDCPIVDTRNSVDPNNRSSKYYSA